MINSGCKPKHCQLCLENTRTSRYNICEITYRTLGHWQANAMKLYNNTRGFTLPELMITLGAIAIVLSTAVPGIGSMIKNNTLASQLNTLVTHIHYARIEAARRDVRVILCRSTSADATTPSCGGDTQIWESGYLVFADDGSNSNDVYNAGTDTLLARGQAATSGIRMRTNSTWNRNLQFNPDGTTNEDEATAIMALCDSRHETHGRIIQVAANGVPRMYADNIDSCSP